MSGSFPTSNSEPPPGSPPRALFVWLGALLLVISFAVLVAASVFCCRRRRDRSGGSVSEHTLPVDGDACGGDPLPVERTPPAFPYAPEDNGENDGRGARECAVCLGAVRGGEMVRQLPACKHLYHVVCIDRWLAARRTCPLCRSQLDWCMVGVDPPAPVLNDAPAPDQSPV